MLSLEEFREKSKEHPTAFGRMNIAFNPDSSSTKVRLIHDFTAQVKGTTLSLEILILDNTLGNMSEAALSFRLFYYIRAYDIKTFYTQFTLVGKFVYCTLNVWFHDVRKLEDLFILLRSSMPFGFASHPQW